jgi:hypothetical protein
VSALVAEAVTAGWPTADAEPVGSAAPPLAVGFPAVLPADRTPIGAGAVVAPEPEAALDVVAWTAPYGSMTVRG